MLRPSMQTLKHIAVNIYFYDDYDLLSGILSTFEDMRTENIIETVTIKFMGAKRSILGSEWGRLDEVLTAPGWFSLKRVSLAVEIHSNNNMVEVALRILPETQFLRLSSSSSVSFDFEVINLYHNLGQCTDFY